MKAAVGDRLILSSTHPGRPGRIGIVVALRHADGSPPWQVRWLDTGHEALVFPGRDARIEGRDEREPARH